MQEVFNFIFSHYEAILSVFTLIISVVVFILRKKPVNSVLEDINKFVIGAINSAETIKVNGVKVSGEQKLRAAVNMVTIALRNKYPNLDISRYTSYIVSVIECILTTPQKKED